MKVEVITLTDKGMENFDYREMLKININGESVFNVMDGEPEDANLARDFSDCMSIPDLIEMAFNAGKKGDPLMISHIQVDDID